MRKLILMCMALSLVGPVFAQDPTIGSGGVTYGEFATYVVGEVTTAQEAATNADSALGYLRGYGFVPEAWQSNGLLTHGDLSQVLARAGVVYGATDPQAPVLASELQRVIDQEQGQLRSYFSGTDDENCTHGYFSQLLVRTISPPQDAIPDQQTAMDRLKNEELVPIGWLVQDILTHGEMREVFARFGVIYETIDQDEPVSIPFAITVIRRELSMLRDYWAKRMGHGFAKSHVLDLGVDRAVSPAYFYHRAHVHNPQ